MTPSHLHEIRVAFVLNLLYLLCCIRAPDIPIGTYRLGKDRQNETMDMEWDG